MTVSFAYSIAPRHVVTLALVAALGWVVSPAATAETWQNVGDPGKPDYVTSTDPNCLGRDLEPLPAWRSRDDLVGNVGAGFYRDKLGFVHLRGTPGGGDDTYLGNHYCPVFVLPPGYRPEFLSWHPAIYNIDTGRFLGLVLIRPSGEVELYDLVGALTGPFGTLPLDGMTFRCAPSGVNGCR